MNTVMSYTNAFERIMNKTEPDYNKRMALTGSLKHSFNRQASLSTNFLIKRNLKMRSTNRQHVYKVKKRKSANKYKKSITKGH